MTKKQLEARVDELEKKLAELTSQVLTLSLRPQQQTVFVPTIQAPVIPTYPVYPTWPPHYPYIGDSPNQPTITCASRANDRMTWALQSQQNIQ